MGTRATANNSICASTNLKLKQCQLTRMIDGQPSFAGAVIGNELVIYILVNILLKQRVEMFEQGLLVKTIFTLLFGMLVYQLLTLFLREEPIEATKRPTGW